MSALWDGTELSIAAYLKEHLHKTQKYFIILIKSYLYKCRLLGSSSVLRKYLENIQTLLSNNKK